MFLEGVRVLEITTFLSGPFAAQLLADLGAEVVKVEARGGDFARSLPPHFVGEDSAYFHAVNRSKRSLQIDLKDERGRALFEDLAGASDVVLEAFRPGVMDRLGLGLDRLRAANPRLVTCSLSGFGSNSPHRDVPAFDAMIQAWSGGMSLTGHPGAPPARMGIPIGDLAAGMYAALGITGALARRAVTGEGDHVDVAMYDAQIALIGYQAANYLVSGEVPGPQGSGHVSMPTYRAFLCGDGQYVMVTANTERMWQGLCRALGLDALTEDPRFETNATRLQNAEELWALLEPAFAARDSQDVLKALRAESVPVGPVNDVGQALADEQVAARNMLVRIADVEGNALQVPGNPIKAGGVRPDAAMTAAPRLGADTSAVLHEFLGLGADDVAQLQASGAVGPYGAD